MTVPDFTVLIPARMASSRLPDKPLADLAGVAVGVRVAQQARQSGARQVVVATDDARVESVCREHGVRALMTRADHVSGSDRLAEACTLLGLAAEDMVVNVQGDEPLIPPALIREVAACLAQSPEASMSTAGHPIDRLADFQNPNVVKLVMDASGMALYFSRAPIPWWRDGQLQQPLSQLPSPAPLRHLGIYGYRVGFLQRFPSLPQAPIEQLESLEQLRALWHGHRIAVHVTDSAPGAGVDTPDDLARVRQILQGRP